MRTFAIGLLAAVMLLSLAVAQSHPDPNDCPPGYSTTGPVPPAGLDQGLRPPDKAMVIIPGVPSYIWQHGCGPTALGMVIGYYDGNGFADLVPGNAATQTNAVNAMIASDSNDPDCGAGHSDHYGDYSCPLDSSMAIPIQTDRSETGGAHADECVADFMQTSFSSRGLRYGWSFDSDVGDAFRDYVNMINSAYAPQAQKHSFAGFSFDDYKEEIDAGRPVVMLVDHNGDGKTSHFITGIGYDDVGNQYAAYNTWDHNVHWYDWHAMTTGDPWGIYSITTCRMQAIDVVFIMDVTGSTGALLPDWQAAMPGVVDDILDAFPNAQFGLASHVDYPFNPYGAPGEWAYRRESPITDDTDALLAALASLTNQWGNDSPESQYEAIYQAVTGEGRDLTGDGDYSDQGEIAPSPMGFRAGSQIVIFHFTWPPVFHDRDANPNYPYPGSQPVAGRTATIGAVTANPVIYFGLVTSAAAGSPLTGTQPMSTRELNQLASGDNPMQELASITGGAVLSVGPDLAGLDVAIAEAIEIIVPQGRIHGVVASNGVGLLGIPVQLCEVGGACHTMSTNEAGEYSFDDLDEGEYVVSLPRFPLGYDPTGPEQVLASVAGDTVTVDFDLEENPSAPGCGSRSNWFWAWQAWGAIQNYQGLCYDRDQIIQFRERVHEHFDPHFDYFVDVTSLRDMFMTLFTFWQHTCRQQAESQFYALLLNVVANRINTYEVISEDGATVAQAIAYCDQLLQENSTDSDKLVLGLARVINWDWIILPAGYIPLDMPQIAYKPEGSEAIPEQFYLAQNYPNPFNPVTDIQFGLPTSQHVRLTVFNIIGQTVEELADENMPAGNHVIQWDASGTATGVYFYRLEAGDFVETKKMLMMK